MNIAESISTKADTHIMRLLPKLALALLTLVVGLWVIKGIVAWSNTGWDKSRYPLNTLYLAPCLLGFENYVAQPRPIHARYCDHIFCFGIRCRGFGSKAVFLTFSEAYGCSYLNPIALEI